MTTRILSFRVLRLALAAFIVGALVFGFPFPVFISWLGVVGFALAWLVVPGDRRWFVPVSLVLAAAAFFWPLFRTFRYQLGDGSSIAVNRLTGEAQVLPPNNFRTTTDWYPLAAVGMGTAHADPARVAAGVPRDQTTTRRARTERGHVRRCHPRAAIHAERRLYPQHERGEVGTVPRLRAFAALARSTSRLERHHRRGPLT